MKSQRHLLKLTTLLLLLNNTFATVLAGEHILIPKLGTVERNDNNNHSVDNSSFDFDDDIVAGFGFSYLYKMDNSVAFGAEFFGYENEIIRTANNDGEVRAGHIYGIAEKSFNTGSAVKPFIGVGLGMVGLNFDANVNGEIANGHEDAAAGLSYEIYAGVEVEINNNIGITVEYKYFNFDVDDDIDSRDIEIESDGNSLLVGVAIHI